MPRTLRYLYWDSCVFLKYINGETGRAEIIETAWDEISSEPDDRIITSALSIVEVGYAAEEKRLRQLNLQSENKINDMWLDPSVRLVEAMQDIMYTARSLMRETVERGIAVLKP